ncbi:MAG: hypothetical protein WAO55_11415 [Candidatus Manganitrophaceae bacterium]
MKLKNKKIACFLALPHHTRFFIPLREEIKKEGGEISFIVPLSDYPFERDLIKRGLSFRYFTDYMTVDVRQKIRETVIPLSDLWAKTSYRWDGFSRWPLFKQGWFFDSLVEEYFCMEKYIEVEKPDMFIAHHECNRWGQIIGHLARKKSVPFVTFQEGDYYNDYIGFIVHTEYSNVDLLWGNKTKEVLKEYHCSDDKMFLIGNTHIDSAVKNYGAPETIDQIKKELAIPPNKKVILFLVDIKYGGIADREVWMRLLKGLETLEREAVLLFKWHPSVFQGAYEKIEKMFKEIYPSAVLYHMYDPYKLIAVSDYCVALGKTTLAIEALAFGKALFALPTSDTLEDYYVKIGIAQTAFPPGNWSNLLNTVKNGVPPEVTAKVDEYLKEYFYRLDGKSVERAVKVLGHIFDTRKSGPKTKPLRLPAATAGRVSFIVPSGSDPEALLATMTSLSQKVEWPDWEVVMVVNDEEMKPFLPAFSGDVRIVEAKDDRLPFLYNKGAENATGDRFVFMKPGVLYVKGAEFFDAIKEGVAGVPIRNVDMTPYCIGMAFDFNSAPYRITTESTANEEFRNPAFVGGGMIGVPRALFESIGGFDEGIADHLIEVDFCLSAREKNDPVRYLPESLGIVFKETFNPVSGDAVSDSDEAWKRRVRFFAKWVGRLPKDENFMKFANDLLKV